MADSDHIRFEASFNDLNASVKEFVAKLEEELLTVKAQGDEARARIIESQLGDLQKHAPATGVPYTAEGQAAIEKRNAALREGEAINEQNLKVIQEETQALLEQVAIVERLKETAVSGTRGADPRAAAALVADAPVGLRGVDTRAEQALLASQAVGTRGTDPRAEQALRASEAATAQAQAQAKILQEVDAEVAARDRLAASQAVQAALDEQRTKELERQEQILAHQGDVRAQTDVAGAVGYARGKQGGTLTASDRQSFAAATGAEATAGAFTAEERALLALNAEVGNYTGLMTRASISTEALDGNLVRLSLVQSEASNQMRAHGALTTEFLSALARGETTISEFRYQIGATISKFAGWTAAAAATYGALGAVVEIGKGAIDSANGVGQLNRTIDHLDTSKAAQAIRDLSSGTAVSVKDASDALFQYSRTFHDVEEAAGAAKLGLGAFTLDQVKLTDSVRLATLVHQQYGYGISGLTGVFNLLSSAQREYNTRLSEMIPLVSTSIGAVKNAGGDLTQLIQLGTVLQRATGLAGTRVGTGIYRAASNFAPANAPKLEQQYGLPDPTKNFTQFLIDAVVKGSQLKTSSDRTTLSDLIFGKQFGGRFAALFTPQSAQTLEKITGKGPEALTAASTKGAFQTELDKQLGTARKELDQFVFGLQRLGSALATSGILTPLGLVVKGADEMVNALTHLAEGFGQLPTTVRSMAEALLIFKAASAFLTGSRFGASVGALPGLRLITGAVPGLSPNTAKVRDQELAEGTRGAIKRLDDQIASQTVSMAAIGDKQIILNERAASVTEALKKDNLTTQEQTTLQAERNRILAQITRLDEDGLAAEARLGEITRVRARFQTQLTGLTTNRRADQLTELQKQDLANSLGVEAVPVTEAAGQANLSGAVAQRAAAANASFARFLARHAAATEELGAATAVAGEAAGVDALANTGAEAEVAVSTGLMQGARNSALAFATRIGDFAASVDPLLIALVGIPLAVEFVKSQHNELNKSIEESQKAATDVAGLKAGLHPHFQTVQPYDGVIGLLKGNLADAKDAANDALQSHADLNAAILQARSATFASPVKQVGYTFGELSNEADADVKALQQHKIDKQEFIRRLNELKQSAGSSLGVLQGSAGNSAVTGFRNNIQTLYQSVLAQSGFDKKDPFAEFEAINDPKKLQQQLQAYDDRSKIYGTNGGDLQKAAYGYTYLANKYRGSTDDTTLQAINSAQQNFVEAVTKNVQDLLKASTSASTNAGETGDLSKALAVIENARKIEQNALDAILKRDKGNADAIKKAKAAADQIFAQLNDQFSTILSAQLAQIQTTSDLKQSTITGISPESDIARAQVALQGLQQQLAKAQAEHADYQIIAGLQTKINNSSQALLKQQIANSDAIAQAQGQLSVAQITGVGPAADTARAQATLRAAQDTLARDTKEKKGQAQILQDQVAVDDAMRGVNQQILTSDQQLHQSLAAYIQSQAGLAESETLDPILQAKEQLAADIKVISTIVRKDYQTEQEYLTALNTQKAKVNTDRTKLNDQIIQTDLSNLAFESAVGKIGDQQYINGLQNILKNKKLTLQERQSIEQQIYQLKQGLGANLDLNVGNIKLPSIYQIRRAIGLGARGELPGAQNTVINHSVSVTVNVTGKGSAGAVGAVLDRHLGTSVKSAMRARGVL